MDMNSLLNIYSPYELYHHGILGQKWGIRRYQNKDGTLTELGRKKYLSDVERGKATEEDRQAYEKTKQKALRSGSARDIQSFRKDLTEQDVINALNRINTDRRLAEAVSYEKTGFDKIDSVMNKVGKVNNWVDVGIRTYKNVDKIKRILDGKPLEDGKKKKKKDD